ncbi:hypothetical protein AB7W88_13390 [Providencia vermicola]|uniref:hypothetical protein n=1 Tax=Providencia TaxID=586 RepID=UPI00234A4968|nr:MULTISPECIES: hypothetical protein [unclassified Providencia]
MENPKELNSILPSESILKSFSRPVKFTEYGLGRIEYLVRNKPNDLFQIGIAAWDRFCNVNPDQDKFIFGKECQSSNPLLYKKVSRHIKEKVIKDILYVHGEIQDPELEDKETVELILAHTYPNILMIVDVKLVNPYKPVTPQKYDFQEYHGLGLFAELLENAIEYCKQQGIAEIYLTAADLPLKKHFEKYGFIVHDTWMGRAALEVGKGIPMSMYF